MSGTHAELSPSKRSRWAACPGSIREEARYPEPPNSPVAIDGTRTHAMLEELVKAGCIRYPESFIGSERTDEYGTFTVDAARVERLNFAIDYIREQARKAGTVPISETRVFPDGLTGRADLHGTIDVQIPGADVYEIIDYKDGMAPVSAENNPQLEQYAIGVLASLEKHPKSFQFTIIQPKLALKGMSAISTWNVPTHVLLERVVPTIVAQAAACDNPNAPLIPGETQCKYCRAKGACPALAGAVNEVITMFAPITPTVDAPLSVPHEIAQKDPHTLSDHELRQIMDAAPLVRQLIDGVEAEIQRRLESGLTVPGYKLVQGKGSRAWSLPEEEMVKKLTGMGIPKASIYETKLISPAKAEKLTWEKKGEVTRLSEIQLKRLANEYVTQKGGKPTVAPESDPRPAIPSAAPLFGAIDVTDTTTVMTIHGDGTTDTLPPFLQGIPDKGAPVPDWLATPSWLQ